MHKAISTQLFVWASGLVCQIHSIPFDQQLLLRQFTPPYTTASLLQVLQSVSLRASFKKLAIARIDERVCSCLAVIHAEDDDTVDFVLLLKSDGERVLILSPGEQTPRAIAIEEFERRYSGRVLLARHRQQGYRSISR